MENIISNNKAMEIIEKNIRLNRFQTVTFLKKDGSERKMMIHRSQALVNAIKGTRNNAEKSPSVFKLVQEMTDGNDDKRVVHQWRNINTAKLLNVHAAKSVFKCEQFV